MNSKQLTIEMAKSNEKEIKKDKEKKRGSNKQTNRK